MIRKTRGVFLSMGVFVWGILIFLSCTLSFGQSESNRSDLSQLAGIRAELENQYGEVRFHREESLEDRFIIHGLPLPAFSHLPRFFQVQSPRFDLSKGFVMESSSETVPTMYVAGLPDTSKIYRLYGFPNPEQEFERLIGDAPPMKIKGINDAEMRGLLCAEVVYGLSPRWWVADPSNAKLQAAERYFAGGHKDGLLRGERWWKSIKGNRTAISIRTVKNEHAGFSVTLPIFWAPVEGDAVPQIRIYQIDVTEDGGCHINKPISVLK